MPTEGGGGVHEAGDDPNADGATRAVRVDGDAMVDLGAPDIGTLLRDPALARARQSKRRRRGQVDGWRGRLGPVLPSPGKIVCVGLNYRSHILEMGRELPAHPTLFAKYTDALVGPYDDVELPPESDAMDWEAELAVVIGRSVRRADATRRPRRSPASRRSTTSRCATGSTAHRSGCRARRSSRRHRSAQCW